MAALAIIGLAMMLFGMIYGRIVDTVTCYFCEANVPRFYCTPLLDRATNQPTGFTCYVCDGLLGEYPFGSSNLPSQLPCGACSKPTYTGVLKPPSLFQGGEVLKGEPNRCAACLRAWRIVARMEIALSILVFIHGGTDFKVAVPRWLTTAPMTWRAWIPFAVVLLLLLAFLGYGLTYL